MTQRQAELSLTEMCSTDAMMIAREYIKNKKLNTTARSLFNDIEAVQGLYKWYAKKLSAKNLH